ncbi:hypothetical protein K9U40_15155 [Xanthobacter autotrophicus]|uniref:hypothetical protein n=1 Tax=Xanthobacter TaxID=279 RepID=UPI0024AA816A|nr:hypothetical protein [Xanthobacter autotrophicus]MDI4665650.1 hypothetical protein [Xanthobacter autotrophicus]
MTDEPDDQKPSSPCHPEEMRATWDLKVGRSITMQGTARWTPAGVVMAGIAASAVLLALSALVRAARRS